MSNIQVQFRRGTTSQHSSFAGAVGEVTVDTDLDTLMVHTGGGAGTGVRLAKHSELGAGGGGTVTSVDSGTGLTGGPITTSGTLSIADNGVTFAKMQDINTAKVIGRTTAGSGDPEEVSILDEDTMTSNSATALATQQSIKAYVDSQSSGVQAKCSFESNGTLNSGGNVNVATVVRNNTGTYTVTFTSAVTNPIVQATIADDTTIHSTGNIRESKIVVSNVSTTGCIIKTGRGSYSEVDCPVHLIVF